MTLACLLRLELQLYLELWGPSPGVLPVGPNMVRSVTTMDPAPAGRWEEKGVIKSSVLSVFKEKGGFGFGGG